jgi:nucleotide-binding universal stress UspA family protein
MIPIERILCPTDLSDDSGEALRYAVALARSYDAKLYLCYCVEGAPVLRAQLCDPEVENIRKNFSNSIIQHLGYADFGKINWEGLIIEGSTDRADAITSAAAERRVDLIVMRSRRRPHRAALLGSMAEAICRTAPCPVLVTHPHEREWVGRTTGEIDLRRVLVAHDFSDGSELALRYALVLAEEYQSEVDLLHVLAKPEGGPEVMWTSANRETVYQNAMRRLQGAVTGEARLWCNVRPAVRWGKPYQEILAYAAENPIDLISMGATGMNHGMAALFGSNVDRVLRQAPCPILIARPLKPSVPEQELEDEETIAGTDRDYQDQIPTGLTIKNRAVSQTTCITLNGHGKK